MMIKMALLAAAVAAAGTSLAAAEYSLTNSLSVFSFDGTGRIVSARERGGGRELLKEPSPFLYLVLPGGKTVAASRAEFSGDLAVFRFPSEDAFVSLRGESFGEGHTFRIVECALPASAALRAGCMVPVPSKWFGTRANMASDEKSGLCVRAYDIFSTIESGADLLYVTIPGDKARGARFGVVASPRGKLRKALQSMTVASGRPRTSAGGPWVQDSEEARGSYLNVNVSAETLDSVLAMVERGGFDVLHMRELWYSCRGHYPVNTNNWPNGLEDMKAAVAKIHAAGYRAGLHTLTGCIDRKDPWVYGPENAWLCAQQTYTLAEDLPADATELTVTEAPKGQHDTVFTYSGRGNALRIGNEIIQYSGMTHEPPYRYTGLTRGAFGTKAASHPRGASTAYLQQRYLAFYPDPDTPLADKVADAIAHVYDTCGFDMIYCDGTEGMGTLYGMAVIRDKIVERCASEGRACINEDSYSCKPQMWWYHSRVGAWDSCYWAPKQFHDKHVDWIKKQCIREADMLEIQMGWWSPYLFHRELMFSAHTLDVMEYYASRNAGLDASMSIWGGYFSQKVVPLHVSRMMTILGWYERARRARAFLPPWRGRFDRKGAEFRFRQDPATGEWSISPVEAFWYRAVKPENSAKRVDLAGRPAKTALRVTALFAGERPGAENTAEMTRGFAAKDFVCESADPKIRMSVEDSRTDDGKRAFRVSAENGTGSRVGSWACASLRYNPYRAIGKCTVLRFRVKGDGSGALLNVQIETPREYGKAHSEHYVTLDFTGWRDFEMPMRERDAERCGDYRWPYDWNYATVFHRWVNRKNIYALNFYLNDVPAGGRCSAEVSDVVLVPDRIVRLKKSTVTVNGKPLEVPFEMESGQFAELEGGFWTLYSPNVDPLRRVRASVPDDLLRKGTNEVVFTGETEDGSQARAQVDLMAVGAPEPALVPIASLPAAAKKLMAYEAADPQLYAPAIGYDALEPVTVRPGEKAMVEVSVFGPTAEFALRVGGETVSVPPVAEGDWRKVVFKGTFSGANPVTVVPAKADGSFSVRLEFVKRYTEGK